MTRLRFALIALAACAGFAATASADSVTPRGDRNLCIDVGSGEARLQRCNGGGNQDLSLDNGYLRAGRNTCVFSQGDGYALSTGRCRDRGEYYWTMSRDGRLEDDTGLCADVERGRLREGQRVVAYSCNRSSLSWNVERYNGGGGGGGGSQNGGYQTTALAPQHAGGLCLDFWHDGGALIVHTCHGGPNQTFSYSYGRGTDIRVEGMCLTATRQGRQAAVRNCNGRDDQVWSFMRDGTIQSNTGLCLDVQNARRSAGTFVNMENCTGSSNQRWTPR